MPVADHYEIELRKGMPPEMEVLRHHEVTTLDDAYSMIEGIRDIVHNRDQVTWQDEEPNRKGDLFGLSPGGVVWQIHVTPPLVEVQS